MAEQQRDLISTDDDAADLLERVDESHVPEGKWPQMLADFIDVLRSAFARDGLDEAQSDRQARLAVTALAEYLGGRMFYLPKGDSLRQAIRHDRIWREFDGQNISQLAQTYEVSERQVYRVLAQQRAMRRARRQGQLFPSANSGRLD